MDNNMLKKLAIKSISLMFAVVLISAMVDQERESVIYANDTKDAQSLAKEDEGLDENLRKNAEELYNKVGGDIINAEYFVGIDGAEYQMTVEELLGDRYITIPKENKDVTNISLEDLYMERAIRVRITGLASESVTYEDIQRTYKGTVFAGKPIEEQMGSDIVESIAISYDHSIEKGEFVATVTMILDSVYVYSLYQDDENYYIHMQEPKDVYNKLIVVDAGHGGNDVGTFPVDMSYIEKDMNLSIVKELKSLLDEEEDIKVYYTRLSDVKPYLRPRVRLANDLKADLFVSVHCNGSTIEQPHGTEVLYNEKSKKEGFNSKDLARICMDELAKATKLRNRGIIAGSDRYIIGNSKVPVVICEVAYMTNESDLEFLKNTDNHKVAATGIYNAIIKSFETIGETNE